MPLSVAPQFRRSVVNSCLAFFFLLLVVLIWQRNRDILRDVYDYSTVITAAGKIEAGLRPYTDVRSPMQTSVYYFNWLTEKYFGANYLGLTCGGLIQAIGGGCVLYLILRRNFGTTGAILLSGAIMLSGLIQHVVFFYNPIGIVCFGLIAVGLAAEPRLWPVCSAETVLVYLGLFIGGTNKLNYQGLAIFIGGLLQARAWVKGSLTARQGVLNVMLLLLAGLVLPIAFELVWTGASLHQWLDQVVLMPGERYDAIKQAFDPLIFLRPAHDFHHHLLFRPIAGLGLALLLTVGVWSLRSKVTTRRRILDGGLRCILITVCIVGSALLMVTNYETVMLTSLAFFLSAIALFIACRRDSSRPFPKGNAHDVNMVGERWIERGILACSVVWSICGGYAAWHGSRVLYAQNPPPLSDYVRLEHAPRPLAYFEGVRFPRPLFDSLQALASRLADFDEQARGMHGFLFAPGLEWLERAYPEAIVPSMPIWYDRGTSLSEDDRGWFESTLEQNGVKRIVSDATWELWPHALEKTLSDNYRPERIGGRFVVYHPRQPRVVASIASGFSLPTQEEFRIVTASNVQMKSTRPDKNLALQRGTHGGFFGCKGGSEWFWPLGPAVLQGEATAVIEDPAAVPDKLVFRIFDGPADNAELLWETPVRWKQGQRNVSLPFLVMPFGRALSFEVQMTNGLRTCTNAGWRHLRITQAGADLIDPALPISPGLKKDSCDDGTLCFTKTQLEHAPDGWYPAPVEFWRRQTGGFATLHVCPALEPSPEATDNRVLITLAWYRAGRFEIVTQRTVDARAGSAVDLEGGVPEADGWIGIIATPLTAGPAAPRIRIQSWRVRPAGFARGD